MAQSGHWPVCSGMSAFGAKQTFRDEARATSASDPKLTFPPAMGIPGFAQDERSSGSMREQSFSGGVEVWAGTSTRASPGAKLLPSLRDGLQHKESYAVGAPIGEARPELMARLADFVGVAYRKFLSSNNAPDSERRLREILDALPAAVYTTDADGRVTMFNRAAATFAGREPQLGTDTWCVTWKLYQPDGTPMPHDQCPMATALKEGRSVRGLEGIAERPDGTRVRFIPYPTPLYDSSGAMVGAVNMIVDITDRKQAEETIARHRDEQAALYEFTDRLFRASSLTDVYDAALDAIRRALGCERASILLFDEAGAMRFVAWAGLSEGYRRAVDGHSPWTRDAIDPQPICIPDVGASDLTESLKATVKAEGIAATAFIPLVVEGKLVGKFMAYYEAPHAFSQADIDLAVTIARQLGFSIQRIRSDEERRRGEQASRLLASIIETFRRCDREQGSQRHRHKLEPGGRAHLWLYRRGNDRQTDRHAHSCGPSQRGA